MFNKNLKNALALSACAVLMITQGCKKSFLDVPPQAQLPSVEFFKTQDDATKAVNSIYGNLREWKQTAFAPMAVESLGSDETEKGSTPGDASFMNAYDNFTVTATDGQLQDFWNGQYQSINLCNQVLDNIPGITMDENLKNRYLAEAKFVRAYNYFRLVRAFGDVVLRQNVAKDASEYNLPRTAKADVYAFIEKDLTEAAAVLPQTYGSADIGRATKGAALALHAKVAMYQKKWNDVLTYTTQVMGMGYSLFPDFEKSFRIQNENNSESVFEVQAQNLAAVPGASTSQYSQIQGVPGNLNLGWGFNVPTDALVAAFETGDPRLDATIIFRGETTPQGDVIELTGPNPRYNQKSYVPKSVPFSSNQGEDQNVRVIRYAEVLLMNAEAANELGNPTQALASLEMVRARARGGNAAILPRVTTTEQGALRTAIWHERQVELAMEFDRYFDVIRQGRAATVFGPKGWKANKNEVWPVPQNEIDLAVGVLTQNPGY